MRNYARRFVNIPVSIVALHSIIFGTLLSAAEYDGWISWGHQASVLMVLPIVTWAICAWLTETST